MKHYLPALIFLLLGCTGKLDDPQQIIDKTLKASGSEKLKSSVVEFEFRDRAYGVKYQNGIYVMVRLWNDSIQGLIRDEVTNVGFRREINGELVDVPDSMAIKYTNSINSVIYFALLPYRLNDEAVIKNYLGTEKIKDQEYYKIEITFKEKGGGKDHDDVFIYWINTENDLVDYFAYSYKVDGGGIRFRQAYNERFIGGVRIVDYINYEVPKTTRLQEAASLFEANGLKQLSKIEITNVVVELK